MAPPLIGEFFADMEKWERVFNEKTSEYCGIKDTFWLITEDMDMRTGPIKNQSELQQLWMMRDKSFDSKTHSLVLVDAPGIVYINNFPKEGTFLVFINDFPRSTEVL